MARTPGDPCPFSYPMTSVPSCRSGSLLQPVHLLGTSHGVPPPRSGDRHGGAPSRRARPGHRSTRFTDEPSAVSRSTDRGQRPLSSRGSTRPSHGFPTTGRPSRPRGVMLRDQPLPASSTSPSSEAGAPPSCTWSSWTALELTRTGCYGSPRSEDRRKRTGELPGCRIAKPEPQLRLDHLQLHDQ